MCQGSAWPKYYALSASPLFPIAAALVTRQSFSFYPFPEDCLRFPHMVILLFPFKPTGLGVDDSVRFFVYLLYWSPYIGAVISRRLQRAKAAIGCAMATWRLE